MSEAIRQLVETLRKRLGDEYGTRLRALYLFGSHAREEASEDSDVDILIVLDRVDSYSEEIDRTSEIISDVSLQFGHSISRVFVSERQWESDQTNFILNVRDEAVAV